MKVFRIIIAFAIILACVPQAVGSCYIDPYSRFAGKVKILANYPAYCLCASKDLKQIKTKIKPPLNFGKTWENRNDGEVHVTEFKREGSCVLRISIDRPKGPPLYSTRYNWEKEKAPKPSHKESKEPPGPDTLSVVATGERLCSSKAGDLVPIQLSSSGCIDVARSPHKTLPSCDDIGAIKRECPVQWKATGSQHEAR